MPLANFSIKRIAINRANLTTVVSVSVATFLLVFALFSGKVMIERQSYQRKVIDKQTVARDTVEANIKTRESLSGKYRDFVETETNVIGGSTIGNGDRDGDNGRIVLDALPSKYDFPALATSIEKLVRENGLTLSSLAGTDEELSQQGVTGAPAPVEIPFSLTVQSDYSGIRRMVDVFERSIRPIQITALRLSGGNAGMSASIDAHTYYQPETGMRYKKEAVE